MSKQLDPLKSTTQELHRFWFSLRTEKQWYDIIRECRQWFGKNWKGQAKVRRKLSQGQRQGLYTNRAPTIPIWFEVPDTRFATWISVKMSVEVQSDSKFQAGK